MTKYCPACKEVKSSSQFAVNRSKPDGLAAQCKSCKKAMQAAWYQKNKARHISNAVTRSKQQKKVTSSYVKEYLSNHSCVDCGESDWVVLEFDHVRGKKKNNVADMVKGGWSLNTIKAEIDKCEVRCANCHRRKHYRQRHAVVTQLEE